MKNKKNISILVVLFISLLLSSIYMARLFKADEIELSVIDSQIALESEKSLLVTLEDSDPIYPNLIDSDLNNLDVDSISKYTIEASLDEENMRLDAYQRLHYTNTEDTDLHTLQLHVFTNAFKRKETSPTTLSSESYAYPNGFSSGYTEFESIMVDGKKVDFEILGSDETKLVIKLNEPLKVKENMDIEMLYSVTIPNCRDRFGYDVHTIQLANWYPVISVYEDGAWYENSYYNLGDPFYTETSLYDIKLDIPKDYILASSGLKEAIYLESNNRKIYKISSDFTRDFAIVMSKYFNFESKIVDGTRISTYTYTVDGDSINEAMESGERTIKSFNEMFGKYPYTDLAIVETSFPSGMEYPGLIMIGNSYYVDGNQESLDEVVNHEIGHQWWYSIVGNDQIRHSWLDEGLTSYSEILYKEYFDRDMYEPSVRNLKSNVEKLSKRYENLVVDKALYEFDDWGDYGFLAYRKSQMFFVNYREKFGEDKLIDALKLHFKKNKFGVTTTEDIIETFEEIAGEDISDISNEVLFDKK